MNHQTFTLLVYSNIPEDTNLYLIPNSDITDEQLSFLKEAHNKLVNGDDNNTGMEFLMAALTKENNRQYFDESIPEEWRCVWTKHEVNKEVYLNPTNLLGGVITQVFVSGFIL